jgi:hypothetical protein
MGVSMKNALKKASERGHTVISDFLKAAGRKLQKIERMHWVIGIQDCDYRNTGL